MLLRYAALLDRHRLELIWLTLERQRNKGALETALPAPLSEALRQDLARPEHRAIARAIGLR